MSPDLIIDVGLHKGEDTGFYLKKGFRVVGIEANPILYEKARTQFAAFIERGRLELLNVAIAEADHPVTFYQNESKTEWSTTSAEWKARNERLGAKSAAIVVEGRRFERILEQFGVPYYLKVDIEGADLLCLQALRAFSEKPRYVSLESTMTSWTDLLGEFALLGELGYRRFKVINQLTVEQQVLPSPSREGHYVEHVFCPGSSGAFGDEAPGAWLSKAQAIRVYRRTFLHYRLFGNNGFFRGIDWRRPLLWRLAKLQNLLPEKAWYDTHASLG